ncbi:DUF58 domain-containing protein [Sulfurimonas autotrophica]|uniref:DUF58 domain-containing protein n=1 Tax=Sulfurimonas autotrophica (strain ATCC BAA-671 / DSM 16294 / JCM 11897 / OK10) TaxID=563040 RepID=E0UQC7_SULAO|nr:DUF58 domain-containing protein [Sulfurimonas autotrophica]ADN08729.1 protein of unknown function DUF58 [Sulfurimonas autotrophica DSM 16294]
MSKLQKILVRARRQVFSEMVGNNPSIFQGEGYDFIELREYMPGDDIRHIDWNITAKLQKPYIKIFREERELNVVIASMLNGSVYFGSKRFKQDVIAEITAMLSFSTIKNGDLLSSYIFSDKMESFLKPSKKLFSVHKSTDEILNFDPLNKKADYKVLADTLFKRLKRKSLIVIVGDFFEIPDFKVLAKKHEVVAVIVRDRLEETPPEMGFTSLVDPESGAVLEGDFNAQTVKEYAKKVLVHDRKLYATFRKHQIRFTKIYTDGKIGVSLRRLFEGR